jgi:beta-glucosidase
MSLPLLVPLLLIPATLPQEPAPAASQAPRLHSAVRPVDRSSEPWWQQRFEAANARLSQGGVGLLFIGDSITQGWESEGKEVWAEHFARYRPVNLGFSGDRTQHVLWRLERHGLEKLAGPQAPKLAVLMIGTNNSNGQDNTAEEIAEGIAAIVGSLRARLPETKVLVLAIFPRGEKPGPQREKNSRASELAARLADNQMVHYLDLGARFLEADGTLPKDIMPDFLHLSPTGYGIWAEGLEPKLVELLGK